MTYVDLKADTTYKAHLELYTETHSPIAVFTSEIEIGGRRYNITISCGSDTLIQYIHIKFTLPAAGA